MKTIGGDKIEIFDLAKSSIDHHEMHFKITDLQGTSRLVHLLLNIHYIDMLDNDTEEDHNTHTTETEPNQTDSED